MVAVFGVPLCPHLHTPFCGAWWCHSYSDRVMMREQLLTSFRSQSGETANAGIESYSISRSAIMNSTVLCACVTLAQGQPFFAGLRILASNLDAENVPRVIVDCARL